MGRELEFFVKLDNLGSCFDLEKNCKKFTVLLWCLSYIEMKVGQGWYLHFNGFDSRCNALQYIVCNKDGNGCGWLWLRLQCENNKNY